MAQRRRPVRAGRRRPRGGWPLPHRLRLTAGGSIAAALLAGCVGADETRLLLADDAAVQLELPAAWQVFGDDALESELTADSDEAAADLALQKQLTTTYGFLGAPSGSLEDMFDPTSVHPWGFARRVALPPTTPYSRAELRSIVLGFDPLEPTAGERIELTVLEQQTIEHGDGLFGERLVYELRFGEERVTTDQTIVRDLVDGSIYQLVLACDAACYQANRTTIDGIVTSWAILEGR